MKKIIVILLIALMVLAVGCKKTEDVEQEKEVDEGFDEEVDETEKELTETPKEEPKEVEQPIEQPKETPKTTPKTTTTTMDPKVKELLDKHKSVKSYSFYLTTTENWELWRDRYFVKGDLMVIKLYEVNMWDTKNYFDSVYLNTADKTGVAYCEDRGHKRCADRDREFSAGYEDFMIKTPLEWLAEVKPNAEISGSEQFDERLSQVISYTQDDGRNVRMWIDRYSGVPVRVEIYTGDYETENIMERYGFRDLSINGVSTADVTHEFGV